MALNIATSAEEGGHEVRGRKSEEQSKMGPNDASDIVWAIGEFFFFFQFLHVS